MRFLLDANVFIDAKNRYYGFDICPGFWNWMDHVVVAGHAASIRRVHDELALGNDELALWVKDRSSHSQWFLAEDDSATQVQLAQIAQFVASHPFTQPARAQFLGGADPWVIAKAKVLGWTVVTLESYQPEARKRVPIPNVCQQFNVPWIGTFEWLRGLAASFTFAPAAAAAPPAMLVPVPPQAPQ